MNLLIESNQHLLSKSLHTSYNVEILNSLLQWVQVKLHQTHKSRFKETIRTMTGRNFFHKPSEFSNALLVPSIETETMNLRSAETARDWMASGCPVKVLTQSPERLSHIRTFPSTQPLAMYLDAPSHAKHVTPSCHKRILCKLTAKGSKVKSAYIKTNSNQLYLNSLVNSRLPSTSMHLIYQTHIYTYPIRFMLKLTILSNNLIGILNTNCR